MKPYLLDAIWAWKGTRSKIRPEWALYPLDDEQLATVLDYMLTYPPDKARAVITKEFSVAPSDGCLSQFYSDLSQFILASRRRMATRGANTIGEEASKDQADLDTANLDLVKQIAFEILSDPSPDPDKLRTVVSAVLKMRDQTAVERRIAVLEKQAADAKKIVEDKKLSSTEQASRLREIFKKTE
jgi:hypothetical protein